MANTYYDSDLTGEQIEQALEAIDGVIVPAGITGNADSWD